MSIWTVDQEEVPRVNTKVRNELYRLEEHPDFKVIAKENDGINLKFDGGVVELGLPDVNEYKSKTLVEEIVILRLLYIDKKRCGEGIGTKILKTIIQAYEDSSAAITIYPIPVERTAWSRIPQMIEDLTRQRKLILFYERLGFKCMKYELIYNMRYLMELILRYSFKKLTPSAMAITFKNTSGDVKAELNRCTITSEEMLQGVTESQYVPELSAFDLLSGRYVT
jgi:GNAT superfamily N-acetyltransferase